jgi:hypothetical protein
MTPHTEFRTLKAMQKSKRENYILGPEKVQAYLLGLLLFLNLPI